MAEGCAELNGRLAGIDSTLRLVSFWTFGQVLEPPAGWPKDLDYVFAAAAVTLPEDELVWYGRPTGVTWLESMLRGDKRPVHTMWRSAEAPVWNHFVARPMLLWDEAAGVRHLALEALLEGHGLDHHREPEPTPTERRQRLEREAEASLAAMTRSVKDYDEHRWSRRELRDHAEPLWEATAGYLDVREALRGLGSRE